MQVCVCVTRIVCQAQLYTIVLICIHIAYIWNNAASSSIRIRTVERGDRVDRASRRVPHKSPKRKKHTHQVPSSQASKPRPNPGAQGLRRIRTQPPHGVDFVFVLLPCRIFEHQQRRRSLSPSPIVLREVCFKLPARARPVVSAPYRRRTERDIYRLPDEHESELFKRFQRSIASGKKNIRIVPSRTAAQSRTPACSMMRQTFGAL